MSRSIGGVTAMYVDKFLENLTDGRYKPAEWPGVRLPFVPYRLWPHLWALFTPV